MGRPAKAAVEHLRVRVWYLAVKTRKSWSDYRLDQEFAWENDRNERKGADRLRVFETIRRRSVSPSSGRHPKRQFDLIAKVDAHPDFAGTSAIYFSPFWTLLQGSFMELPEIHEFTKEQLMRCGIHRPTGKFSAIHVEKFPLFDAEQTELDCEDWDLPQVYEASLRAAITDLPVNLDLLALLGGLFREAYLVCALEIAVCLKELFLHALNAFCAQHWLDDADIDLLDMAEEKILNWRIGNYAEDKELYGAWPSVAVKRPLVKMTAEVADLIKQEDAVYSALFPSKPRPLIPKKTG